MSDLGLPFGLTLIPWDVSTWPLHIIIIYTIVIIAAMEGIAQSIHIIWHACDRIAVKGKHLDSLSALDIGFIIFNKLSTAVFTYHLIQIIYYTSSIKKLPSEVTIANTIGSMICFIAFYDLFYHAFHRVLHFRSLYGLIHKHHHKQKAPSRGNLDALNVHPFEFVVGEYLHIVTVYVIPCHMYAIIFFILFGGIFASLNHTRYDWVIGSFYSVKAHDIHHRLPETNYAQYTMYWDKLFGTYRDYESSVLTTSSSSDKLD